MHGMSGDDFVLGGGDGVGGVDVDVWCGYQAPTSEVGTNLLTQPKVLQTKQVCPRKRNKLRAHVNLCMHEGNKEPRRPPCPHRLVKAYRQTDQTSQRTLRTPPKKHHSRARTETDSWKKEKRLQPPTKPIVEFYQKYSNFTISQDEKNYREASWRRSRCGALARNLA